MKKTIYLILLLLVIPLVSADGRELTGGSGGGGTELALTYEQCSALLDDAIEKYNDATDNANRAFGIFLIMFIALSLYLVITLLVGLGMAIQQIKDDGFKQWWGKKWKRNKDEDNRNKKK